MASYIETITNTYRQLNIPFTDNEIMQTYDEVVKIPESELGHKLQTLLTKKHLCKKLTNNQIEDPVAFLISKGIATGNSTVKYGIKDESFNGKLTANSYLTVHKKITNNLSKYKLVVIYSIPHKTHFVISVDKLRVVPKIETKYSFCVETKEFSDFNTVFELSKILKEI